MFKSWEYNIHIWWNRFNEWCGLHKDALAIIVGFVGIIVGLGSMWVVYWMTSEQNSLTEKSLKLAQQNYIDENRPFIFPTSPTIIISYGTTFAYVPIVNYGKTPAYRIRIGILLIHHAPPADSTSAPYDPRTWPAPDKIYEKIFAPSSQDTEKIKMSEFWSDTLATGRIYLAGKIWYVDYWKREHYTTFAYTWYSINHGFVRIAKYESTDEENQYSK
jgi:hypothetical protein